MTTNMTTTIIFGIFCILAICVYVLKKNRKKFKAYLARKAEYTRKDDFKGIIAWEVSILSVIAILVLIIVF